jgi:hypothetical protein
MIPEFLLSYGNWLPSAFALRHFSLASPAFAGFAFYVGTSSLVRLNNRISVEVCQEVNINNVSQSYLAENVQIAQLMVKKGFAM